MESSGGKWERAKANQADRCNPKVEWNVRLLPSQEASVMRTENGFVNTYGMSPENWQCESGGNEVEM